MIGNMQTAALVSTDATIDFFCYPEFDSPTVFAALLDGGESGGSFSISPQLPAIQSKQIYLSGTNMLVTRLLSDDGVAEITDFMPVSQDFGEHANQVVRCLRVIKGEIRFLIRCAPRFGYGRAQHSTSIENGVVFFRPQAEDLEAMSLRSNVTLSVDGSDAVADITLGHNQTATFAFGSEQAFRAQDPAVEHFKDTEFEDLFAETSDYWRAWIGQSTYKGRWREMVNRSALVLKLLSSREYGSLIAAPTFGLPERLGGSRNWDYRLTWLRDSSFTLYAFMRLGFKEEMKAFGGWMRHHVEAGLENIGEDGPLKPMYRIHDSSNHPEVTLDNLSGYRDSRPVRIGNAAESQLQLDVYGELMDALYQSSKYVVWMSNDGWKRMCSLMDWLLHNWDRADQGIWEVRNGQQHFLHSRLMCWVAFDRVIRLAQKRSLVAPIKDWTEARDAIHEDIFNNFWSDTLNSFVQAKGSETLDASVLLMPLMRFISPHDPRWLSTMNAIEEHLTEGGLVYRYGVGTDGLDGTEGSFTPCSFWFIECLARSGQVEKAQFLFDRILSYANHLGLYSEELASNGDQLGNFPQALTHLALISAAYFLDRELNGTKDDTWQ